MFGVVIKPPLGDGGLADYVTVSPGFGLGAIPVELPWQRWRDDGLLVSGELTVQDLDFRVSLVRG